MLAGRVSRISPASDLTNAHSHEGLIKLRLGHSTIGSVLILDQLFVKAGPWQFFQPSFFGPCFLSFNIEPGLHSATLSIDVACPLGAQALRIFISIRSDGRVKSYADGSQLYSCRVETPGLLTHFSAGRCQLMRDGDFALNLFHHTNAAAQVGIRSSGELWAPAWNLQGTRRLINVAYVYLSSLSKIECPGDLNRIAMASDGKIRFQSTSDRSMEEVLELTVYRENTTGRTHVVPVEVPSAFIAPPHLLAHPMVSTEPAYYEVIGPEIFRIGLNRGATLPIPNDKAMPAPSQLKRFDYVIMGDARELAGPAAPYNEEETHQVMHLERLDKGIDFFAFWHENANTDQVSARRFDPRRLEPH